MPEYEKKELTPEESVAQAEKATAELEALKAKFGKVTFTVNGKEHQLNLLDEGEFKKGQQFLAGGATFAQDKATFNKEKAEMDAIVKTKVEAELQARGQPRDAAGEPVDVEKLIADSPELVRAIEDGDSKAFTTGLAKVLKAALKSRPKSEQPGGVTEERLQEAIRDTKKETENSVIFKTRVRPNPQFVALAKHLAEVNNWPIEKAEAEIVSQMSGVDPSTTSGMTPDAVILEKVVKPWSERLGLKSAEPTQERDESGRFKEAPPVGSKQAGAGGGSEVAPKFNTPGELDAWMEKERTKQRKTGKWSPGDWK
jgi:hypothetical protein